MPSSGYFDQPFGNAGMLAVIPDAIQLDGSVSYNQGWGIDYTLPSSNPSYKYMPWGQFNQLFYDITSAIQVLQQGSAPAFITSAMNGGTPYTYPKYAMVSLGGVTYVSNQAGNADTPPSAKWNTLNISTPGLPYSSVTGNTHAFVAADLGGYMSRSNSAVAMADTLPNAGAALDNGWFTYVENNDASASLTISSSGTIKQGNLTGSVIILPGELWLLESEGSSVYRAQRIASATLHSAPIAGSFKNLAADYVSNTTASLSADEIVVEDANGNTRKLSIYNQTLNTAVVGAGGLDTGTTAASTWYYLWVIFNPTTTTQSVIMSLSNTAPTMPAGYTYKALSGVLRLDGSKNIIGFRQRGKRWQYVLGSNLAAMPQMSSGSGGSTTIPTWVAAAVGNFVPTALASRIALSLWASATNLMVAPNNNYGALASTTNPPFCAQNVGSNSGVLYAEMMLESTNIYWAGSGSIYCNGFEINL